MSDRPTMTVAEFKRLVASIPDRFDGYAVSRYTDIGEIRGIAFCEEQKTMWLEDDHDGLVFR
jgi:hypothetical protein